MMMIDTMKKTGQNASGFTLMEVLIAIVLMAVGLLGMAALTGGIMRGNNHSSDLTTATVLAQEKIEDIRRIGYYATPGSDTTTTEAYGTISGFSRFKRTTQTDVDNPTSNMKAITVTVFWDTDAKSVTLKTLLAE